MEAICVAVRASGGGETIATSAGGGVNGGAGTPTSLCTF